MFQVGRYDPREEDRKLAKKRSSSSAGAGGGSDKKKKKTKKTKHEDDDNSLDDERTTPQHKQHADGPATPVTPNQPQTMTTLRVIAPEAQAAPSADRKVRTKLNEEAFDDLDINDDDDAVIENGQDDERDHEDDDDGEKTKAAWDPTDEIQRALHMSKLPIEEAAQRWGLAPFLVSNLLEEGHRHFFPIQALVIPDVIIAEQYSQMMRARDVCVAAPTGSGKTLAFVLPVLNALATRNIRRLRALVVLPSRDLAKQVYQVFERYAKGSDLKIGLAIGGQSDFRMEQEQLLFGDHEDGKSGDKRDSTRNLAHLRHALNPGNLHLALDAFREQLELDGAPPPIPQGGISAVDVLVCTPGRLVDHCDNTPGFTLQHLRFLVIDEADRLLSQSYHGWIARVFDNSQAAARNITMQDSVASQSASELVADPITWRLSDGALTTGIAGSGSKNSLCRPVQLRKLLYSATLTKDPQKLAALKLVNPKHFNAHHLTESGRQASSALYSMPEQLQEYTVECTAGQKPLVLLSLLLERLQEQQQHASKSADDEATNKSIIVVFTSSLDSTHRLARLLQLLWKASETNYGEPPIEFSSSMNQHQRSAFMKRCNDPEDPVSVVICSDGMSRGMDIGFVGAVINYDVPGFAKTYVHRCGRTARAGKQGEAISLLKGSGQSGQFQKLRRLIDHPERVAPYKVKTSLVKNSIRLYQQCVVSLKDLLAAEQQGEIRPMDMEIDNFVP